MKNLFVIRSSLLSLEGESSKLAQKFITQWREQYPDAHITLRDVAADPIPHLDAQRVNAFFTAAEIRTPEQQAIVAQSDALIEEIKQADFIVIGVPMYNFG